MEMKGKAMKPVSWSFVWALTSTAQYVLLKYDTCCCGVCWQLGFDNYGAPPFDLNAPPSPSL